MEVEYSNEVRGRVFAYRFEKWEKAKIAEGLKNEIKKLNRKVEATMNHPKNEGQVTFSEKIRELKIEIEELQSIVDEFSE